MGMIDVLSKNLSKIVAVPLATSGLTFMANLGIAASDGKIDAAEYQQLMQGASTVEFVTLLLVMGILWLKNRQV